jgi:hypothetical protein
MDAFDPIDRPEVAAPDMTWVPWDDLDYFGWRHPTEPKAYMVVPLPERCVGLVLRMNHAARTGMCDLCYGIDRLDGATMAMVQSWERPRTSHGIHLCVGLDCSEAARGLKWVYRMGETISVGRRIERLQENVERFARSVTGLKAPAPRT